MTPRRVQLPGMPLWHRCDGGVSVQLHCPVRKVLSEARAAEQWCGGAFAFMSDVPLLLGGGRWGRCPLILRVHVARSSVCLVIGVSAIDVDQHVEPRIWRGQQQLGGEAVPHLMPNEVKRRSARKRASC